MAYDEDLAERVREILAVRTDVTERKMFGGIAFMVAGNMACGVLGQDLVLRLGEENASIALDEPHTRPFDFTGRPEKATIYAGPAAISTDAQLTHWVHQATRFAATLQRKR
ncbi:TfoX/Sxy family protein [Streptomyces sp. SYSU K217416]